MSSILDLPRSAGPSRDAVRALGIVELPEAIAGIERQVSALHAQQLAMIAELDRRIGPFPSEWAREEVGLRCRVGVAQAASRLHTARALEGRCALTREHLAAGQISLAHAVAMVEATSALNDAETAWVERTALCDPRAVTSWQLGYRARKAALQIVPADETRGHGALRERSLTALSYPDGGVGFHLSLPAVSAAVVTTWLRGAAVRQGPDDDRAPSERRADALLALIRGALDRGTLPPTGDGRRPHLELVASWDAWERSFTGAEVAGVPVPFHHLPETVCDADVRLTHVDPGSGRVVDQGRTTRIVSAALRGRLTVRDGHCRFPPVAPRRRAAGPTTSGTGPTVGPPTRRTSCWSASATTTPSTTGAGRSPCTRRT